MSDAFLVNIVVDATRPISAVDRIDTAIGPTHVAIGLKGGVVQYLQERMKDRFAGGGDDVVGEWEPLAPATLNIKENTGTRNSGINIRTGALYDWITEADGTLIDPTGETQILEWPGAPPARSELTDKLWNLQFGSDDPPADPRPLIGANSTDLAAILTILGSFIFAEAGLSAL